MSKKRVRERMARTGESYQQALVAMREGRAEPQAEHCMRDPSATGACAWPDHCSCGCNICDPPC